uniref:Rho-GAP domain-containing protein n=1 Tax=Mesocestoides corti TaxID=53468 RepID=A0A5K3EQU1_MESCO
RLDSFLQVRKDEYPASKGLFRKLGLNGIFKIKAQSQIFNRLLHA